MGFNECMHWWVGQDSLGVPSDGRKEGWFYDALKAYGPGPKQKKPVGEGRWGSMCRQPTHNYEMPSQSPAIMKK